MREVLIERFRQGDDKSWKYIYQLHSRRLVSYASSFTSNQMVSEEIVNDSFLKVYKLKENYRSLKELEKYLFRIVTNACIDYLRRIKSERLRVNKYSLLNENSEDEHDLIDTELKYVEVIDIIVEVMKKQPPQRKKVVEYHYQQGKAVREIADLLNINQSGVYKHLDAFKNEVRKKMPGDSSV